MAQQRQVMLELLARLKLAARQEVVAAQQAAHAAQVKLNAVGGDAQLREWLLALAWCWQATSPGPAYAACPSNNTVLNMSHVLRRCRRGSGRAELGGAMLRQQLVAARNRRMGGGGGGGGCFSCIGGG